MRFAALVLVALALTAAPAFGQKVYIDYDQNHVPDGIKTFAWRTTPDTSLEKVDPLLHSRILNGIEYYITRAGAHEVQENPDVWVTYHTSSREQVALNTTNYGYGYPGGWYGRRGFYGGAGMSSTTVTTYQRGTLVVDVWDAKTNELVWRGTADNITVSKNPEKMWKRLDKAIDKMVKKWQKIKEQNAKQRSR